MSRNAKLIIYGVILLFSIVLKIKNNNEESKSYSDSQDKVVNRTTPKPIQPKKPNNVINNDKPYTKLDKLDITFYPTPENGHSPYDDYFGKGIYNNSTGNKFTIKNSNSTDAVVLLVNAYSGRKVRNEFIRKGSTFSMTGVPNGTYYLEWASGNNWSPYKKVGNLTGGFQSKSSFTKTRDRADWMAVSGYQEWTVTLYAVEGGDVESERLTENEFGN